MLVGVLVAAGIGACVRITFGFDVLVASRVGPATLALDHIQAYNAAAEGTVGLCLLT